MVFLKEKVIAMSLADLHVHTTASDGVLSPEVVIRWADKLGLAAIAITDHDTTEGLDAAIERGSKVGLEVIPGIELGTYVDGCEVHILGYYIHYSQKWFQSKLESLKAWRNLRAEKLIENLNDIYDIDMDFEHVRKIAGNAAISRPHIGRALMDMGLAKDLTEAFNKYIGNKCPAYVPRRTLSPQEGIDLIKRSGGIPILAHPGLIENKNIVNHVIDLEIEGMEVFHPSHTVCQEAEFFKICQQKKLLVTGGSDFHDELVDGVPVIGQKKLHYSHVRALKTRAKKT